MAAAPGGKEQEGSHVNAFAGVAGVLMPLSVRLNAGETHELEFPLKDIIFASGNTVKLEALLKQGYSVRVRFERKQAAADWANFPHAWIGRVSTGEVSPAQ